MNRNAPDEQLHIRHDDNGRMVVDHLGQQYDYDDKGVLLAVRDANGQPLASFHYLPDGILGHIHNGNKRQSFYYHNNGQVQTVIKNGKLHDYIRYSNKFLGALTEGGTEQLFISNQSTGARLNVDKKGKKSANFYDYEGYGEGYEQSSSAMDTDDSSSSDFLWNQEFRDKATGLVYLRHRFYHPDLRRFTTRDTKSLDNRYAYAVANPIAFTDPSGQSAVSSSVQIISSFCLILYGVTNLIAAITSMSPAVTSSAIGNLVIGVTGLLSGIALRVSQDRLDNGHKTLGEGLRYTGIALGVLSLFSTLAVAAPHIYLRFFANTANTAAQAISDSVAGPMPLTSSSAYWGAETETTPAYLQNLLTNREPPSYEAVQPHDATELFNTFRRTSQGGQESVAAEARGDLYRSTPTSDAASAAYPPPNYAVGPPPPYQEGQLVADLPPDYVEASLMEQPTPPTGSATRGLISRFFNWFRGQPSTDIHASAPTEEGAATHQVETYF